jgi:hypothetical protein
MRWVARLFVLLLALPQAKAKDVACTQLIE